MSLLFLPVISRVLNKGTNTRPKKIFFGSSLIVSYAWFCPFTNKTVALHETFNLHLCSLKVTHLIAAFFKASTGGIRAALSQSFEFFWHAPGWREDRRGLLGVEVLNFWKTKRKHIHLSFSSQIVSRWPWYLYTKIQLMPAAKQVQVPHPIASTTWQVR